MPYRNVSEVPDYVPKAKRAQWLEVWNSAYKQARDDGKDADYAEAHAFTEANGVVKKEGKALEDYMRKFNTAIGDGANSGSMSNDLASSNSQSGFSVNYTPTAGNPSETCSRCLYFDAQTRHCLDDLVAKDAAVPEDSNGQKVVAPGGWCKEFALDPENVEGGDGTLKARAALPKFRKFIPFAKVDAAKREVWGIVTAEVPDKDDEVCDYEKSKPYYKAVIEEMGKATNGQNFFPLREMHQLSAAGKCVGFEFKDTAREIYMGFKVVDDAAWKKVDEGVYTGFSQGGRKVGDQVPDPVYKGCQRYVADPSEVSLVDNPCLGVAHFTYVNKSGGVEMRKFLKMEEAAVVPLRRLDALITKAIALQTGGTVLARGGSKAASGTPGASPGLGKGKTKRVAGEDLPSSAFAYVGDADRTETWKLPIKFSTDEKTKSHIRNALARFSSTQGIPSDKRSAVYQRIVNAAKQHGIEVSDEKALISRIHKTLRTAARIYVNRKLREAPAGATGMGQALAKLRPHVSMLDDDLGRLQKGMYEVSRLAACVQEIGYLTYAVCNEQAWEGDENSPLPEMVASNVNSLMDTLLAMVKEETDELRAELQAKLAAGQGGEGEAEMAAPVSI